MDVSVVDLRMPPEVLDGLLQVSSDRDAARCVIAVDGEGTELAQFDVSDLREQLMFLSQALRAWAFANAGHRAYILRMATDEFVRELPLPPNVSARAIHDALEEALPGYQEPDARVIDLRAR